MTVVAERPIPGRPRPFRFPSFSRARLGNGMQVLACDLPGRTLVTARLVLDAGDACDPQGKEGVASLTGHLVWEGSERYDAETFAAEVETIGAAVGSDADETMTAWVRVPAARAERGLELLAEAVRRPVFAEREVNRLRAEAANSIRQQNARPLMRSLRAFAGFALAPGCRLALPTAGTVETVEGLARDDVVAHHRAFFTPAGAALIVAGDLGVLDVAVTAEHMFGDWAAPEPVRDPRPAREAIGRTAVVVVNRPGSVQSNFVFGHLGVGHDVPDHDVIEVVTHELGGSFNSRINRKLREEKGYTYGAGAAFDERRREGLFYVYAPVETSVTADALRDAIAEVRAVHADGITEAELEDARSYLGGVSAIQFETPGGIAGGLGEIVIHGLPDDHFDAHAARLAEVSLDDAARTARERLRPDRMAIAVVGDAEKIGASLEEFGPMTVVEDS